MKINPRAWWGTAVLVMAVGAYAALPPQESREGRAAESAAPGLLRTDLLAREAAPFEPPSRNIFSPQRGGARPGQGGIPSLRGNNPEAEAPEPEEVAPKALVERFDVRYIGYIRSAERTVAVILFSGEALAVKAGDVLPQGVTIVTVTPDELVYQGMDSVSKTVALEGDDR